MKKQIEIKQEVRQLKSQHCDGSIMYPAPLLFTWVRVPGFPVWTLANVEATLSADK